MKRKANYAMLTLAAAIGLTASAQAATSIAILNAGFESADIPTNTSQFTVNSMGNIASWTWSGNASQGATIFNDGNIYAASPIFIAGSRGGFQYAGLHSGASGATANMSQNTSLLWQNLTPGDTLAFSVYTTYRADIGFGTATLTLKGAGGGAVSQNITASVAAAPQGVWTLQTLTHVVTPDNIALAAPGAAVGVQIGNAYANAQPSQLFLDDVSLVHTPVPEPSTTALLGGLGLLGLMRRRR